VPVVTTRRAGRVLERPEAGPLADALADLLARAPERAAARAAVAGRARKPWLERLVRELESLARSRSAPQE